MSIQTKNAAKSGPLSAALSALLLGGVLMTPGCGSPEQYWSGPAAPKENQVDWVTYKHKIEFQSPAASLTNGERDRFEKFLDEIDLGYGDQIALGIAGDAGSSAQLADRRLDAVRSYLRGRAVESVVAPPARQGTWDGSVTVVIGRYVLTPPSCPNWEKPPGYDFNNTEDSNLGCATATNLGLMLANPGDLARSRNMSPGDGTTQAKAVDNFRQNKTAKGAASVSGSAAPGSSSTAAGSESQTEGGGGK